MPEGWWVYTVTAVALEAWFLYKYQLDICPQTSPADLQLDIVKCTNVSVMKSIVLARRRLTFGMRVRSQFENQNQVR